MKVRMLQKIVLGGTLAFSPSISPSTSLAAPPGGGPSSGADCSGIMDSNVDYEIHDIQGSGSASPLEGKDVMTCGTVTATTSNGYWIQDTTEDGDRTTSEGIFVYRSNGPGGIIAGHVVSQTAKVTEYYGLTELNARREPKVIGSSSMPTPTEITSSMNYADLESLEGMLVTVTSATVVAGSNKYNETFVVPGSTTSRVDRKDTTTPYFKIDDLLDNHITGASTFDTITGNPTGPFDYNFGAYTLQWDTGSVSVSDEGHTENILSADTTTELTVTTFNVENYFAVGSEVSPGDSNTTITQEEFDTKTAKLSLAVRNNLGSPDILTLQEVEKIEVLDALASKISEDGGPTYTPYLIEGSDGRGIDVAYLVKEGMDVLGVEQFGKYATTVEDGCGPSGTDLLFSRPPLVLRIQTDSGQTISIINNHFKSKGGSDECRNEQASFVADVANNEAANGYEIVVTGDLNSFEDEESLNILETNANLTNLIYDIPIENAFSYIYTGKAQFLDHMLVSSNLTTQVSSINSAKLNPDFAIDNETDPSTPLHVSDHDPIRLSLN
ncbi:endonuclease/exonuclease/phosphatase family protein [Alkalihalobacillus sp. AL-G]|uniref:endonuclease/exonuclease/phosphatase family protein n=1 Tax=Alkalihalobacillus sp. AL-G TaxID=2926399 RepID=UPI00272D86CB|nr:endonuclease/exonuclease/phosphatase family protein [Alkalihalobacillus sp. AL-G]WLD92654.1 endonuclease/exonuclease/phosphatase family protein [Alkalihalobacillus sp. AL-G]